MIIPKTFTEENVTEIINTTDRLLDKSVNDFINPTPSVDDRETTHIDALITIRNGIDIKINEKSVFEWNRGDQIRNLLDPQTTNVLRTYNNAQELIKTITENKLKTEIKGFIDIQTNLIKRRAIEQANILASRLTAYILDSAPARAIKNAIKSLDRKSIAFRDRVLPTPPPKIRPKTQEEIIKYQNKFNPAPISPIAKKDRDGTLDAKNLNPSSGNEYIWGSNFTKDNRNKELRTPITNESKKGEFSELIKNSLVPFYFVDLRSKNYCFFNATISGLSETYVPSWNRENYFGRTEGISTYTNTDRNISVTFNVIADDRSDLPFIYKKLEWLAQTTYPQYKDNDSNLTIEKPPLIRMRIGDLIKYQDTGLGGYLTNISINYKELWETLSIGMKVPIAAEVSIDFTVIHDKMPESALTKFYNIKLPFDAKQIDQNATQKITRDDIYHT